MGFHSKFLMSTSTYAQPTALPKSMAAVRIAASVFFLLFGEYKLAGPAFAHGGFQTYLQDFIANGAISFYLDGSSISSPAAALH